MKIDKFEMGNWIIGGAELIDWPENGSFEDFLEMNDYHTFRGIHFGRDYEALCSIYFHNTKTKCIVDIFLGDTSPVYYVSIENMPSLLIFLKDYEKIFKKKISKFIEGEGRRLYNKQHLSEIKVNINYNKDHRKGEINALDKYGVWIPLYESSNPVNAIDFVKEHFDIEL